MNNMSDSKLSTNVPLIDPERDTTSIFKNGRSQAVRLPAQYRFDCDKVYVRRDPDTGDVVLSSRPSSWSRFFALVDSVNVDDDFMSRRDNETEPERDIF